MCGIIGYVGPRECKPLLLQGLERLEYRGYDSAGIALSEEDGLDYVRAVGNLQNLKLAAGPNGSQARHGLGHTRWATHGGVTEANAHPLNQEELGRATDEYVIAALNVPLFSAVEAFKSTVDKVIRDLRTSRRMPGVEHIRLPGEQSHTTWLERSASGVPINDTLFKDLQRLATELGVEGLPSSGSSSQISRAPSP